MARSRRVVVIGGRAFDPKTGQAVGFRPGERARATTVQEMEDLPPTLQEQALAEQRGVTARELRRESLRQLVRQQILEKGLSPKLQRQFLERATPQQLREAATGRGITRAEIERVVGGREFERIAEGEPVSRILEEQRARQTLARRLAEQRGILEEERLQELREQFPTVPESQISGLRARAFEATGRAEERLAARARQALGGKTVGAIAAAAITGIADVPRTVIAPQRFAQETARGAAQLVSGLSGNKITRFNIKTGLPIETIDVQLTREQRKKLAVEAGASIVAMALIGAGLKFVKIRKIKIPTSKGAKIIRTLGVETKAGRAKALISVKDGRIKFGNVDITKELRNLPEGFELKPGSALETRIIKDALRSIKGKKISPRARAAIPIAQRILRKTQKTKSSFVGELPKRTERLNEIGTQVLYDVAREEKGLVFGSASRKAQQFGLERGLVVRDIDIRIESASPTRISQIVEKTMNRLRNSGFTVRKKGVDGIEVLDKGVWKKIVEFKTEGFGSGEIVPAKVLGFDKFGKPRIVSGQQVSSLAEELRGVTQGVIRIKRKDGIIDIYPPEGRIKDIKAVVESASTLRESQIIPRPGLKQDIQEFRALFPEAIFTTNGKELVANFQNIPSVGVSPISVPSISIVGLGVSPAVSAIPTQVISPPPSPPPSPIVSPTPSPFVSPTPSPFVSPQPSPPPSPPPSPIVSPTPSPFVSPQPSPPPSPPPSPIVSPIPSPFVSPTPSPITAPPSPVPIPPTKKPTKKQLKEIAKKLDQALEFQAFAKIKGKFEPIGEPGLKQETIKFGAEFVGKESLAATFQVKPTGRFITGQELPFEPSREIFRKFRRLRGRQIPLENVWIERRRFRLERGGREVAQIQRARAGAFFGNTNNNPRPRRNNQGANMFFK